LGFLKVKLGCEGQDKDIQAFKFLLEMVSIKGSHQLLEFVDLVIIFAGLMHVLVPSIDIFRLYSLSQCLELSFH